jgi:hypothetical protein
VDLRPETEVNLEPSKKDIRPVSPPRPDIVFRAPSTHGSGEVMLLHDVVDSSAKTNLLDAALPFYRSQCATLSPGRVQ